MKLSKVKTFWIKHYRYGSAWSTCTELVAGSKLHVETEGSRGNGAVVFRNPRRQKKVLWVGSQPGFGDLAAPARGYIVITSL